MTGASTSVLLAVLLLPFAAVPSTPEDVLDRRVEEADFIFVGRVAQVSYTNAVAPRGEPFARTAPYTYVTYEVERVLKGSVESSQLTLRFDGGPLGDGTFMISPDFPLFDEGEVGLLMVVDNTRVACPLVDCAYGRYRFSAGEVASEDGQRIDIDSEGHLVLGPQLELEEVFHHMMGETPLSIEVSADPATVEERLGTLESALPATPEIFTELVAERVSNLYTEQQLRSLPGVRSADPSERLLEVPPHVGGYRADSDEASGEPVQKGTAASRVDVPRQMRADAPAPASLGAREHPLEEGEAGGPTAHPLLAWTSLAAGLAVIALAWRHLGRSRRTRTER